MGIKHKNSFMVTPLLMPEIFPVTCHTDFVGQGSIFVAIEGYADNGLYYVRQAIEKGARTIVVRHGTLFDESLRDYISEYNISVEYVDNTRKALALLSAEQAGNPAQHLKIIGITGTKGKTTTSFLLEHIMDTAGHKTALISSVQNRICGHNFSAPLTTPQPDYLHQFLKLCVENCVDYVIMEVAAQALTLHRVEGIRFCGIIFTNFSHEHLEFYATLDDYFNAKCLLLTMAAPGAPILINRDNERCAQLLSTYVDKVIGYGFTQQRIGYTGSHLSKSTTSINVRIKYHDIFINTKCFKLFGDYNAYNVLAATSMALSLKIDGDSVARGLQSFSGVPGRLQEYILANGARCFIDYAHNPESFYAVLSTLRLLTSHLIVLFGAGGGKDKLKRPIMGSIAAEIADIVVITSDNPRFEDPVEIADEIIDGIALHARHKIVYELDRKKAIEQAYFLSDQGSIIALLGKGPDEYQIIGKTKYYFSEKEILRRL